LEVIALEETQSTFGEAGNRRRTDEAAQEVGHQVRNVLPPFAERLDRDLDDADPVEEVTTELAESDRLLEIAVA
jgi:hypothetical protein